MKTNENATQNPAPKKGKTYFPILKTKEEVAIYLGNFAKCKEAFPKLVEQVNIKAMHASTEDMDNFVKALLDAIGTQAGTVRSTLAYARNHAHDGLCPLAHDSETLEALKQAAKDIKDFEKGVEFAISQSRTMSVFHDLARGVIPSGYTVPDVADPASGTGESDATETIEEPPSAEPAEPQEDTPS